MSGRATHSPRTTAALPHQPQQQPAPKRPNSPTQPAGKTRSPRGKPAAELPASPPEPSSQLVAEPAPELAAELATAPSPGTALVPSRVPEITALDRPQPAYRNPARVYLATLSPGSRPTMLAALNTLADLLHPGADLDTTPWQLIRYEHIQALRAVLLERCAPSTANKALTALRQVLKHAWNMDQIDTEPYLKAKSVPNFQVDRPEQAAGRSLSSAELGAILQAALAQRGAAAERDSALIALGYGCGLRRAELCRLQLRHYDARQHRLTFRGKRGKTRVVALPRGAVLALDRWIALLQPPTPESFLFVHIGKGSRLTAARLSVRAVNRIIEKLAARAGVEPFTPHDMRRTYAGDLLDAGVDLVTVQKLMGHSSPSTTAGYDRRGERVKDEAAGRLHVPFFKKEG